MGCRAAAAAVVGSPSSGAGTSDGAGLGVAVAAGVAVGPAVADDVALADGSAVAGGEAVAVALAIAVVAIRAARDPVEHRGLFDLLALAGVLLAVVHMRGLIEDSQPLIEHLEVGMYLGFGVLAWWCKPPVPSVDEPRISPG